MILNSRESLFKILINVVVQLMSMYTSRKVLKNTAYTLKNISTGEYVVRFKKMKTK